MSHLKVLLCLLLSPSCLVYLRANGFQAEYICWISVFEAIADERRRFQANCELTAFSLRNHDTDQGSKRLLWGLVNIVWSKKLTSIFLIFYCFKMKQRLIFLKVTSKPVSCHIPGENPSIPDDCRRPETMPDWVDVYAKLACQATSQPSKPVIAVLFYDQEKTWL